MVFARFAFVAASVLATGAFAADSRPCDDVEAVVSLLDLVLEVDASAAQKCLGVITDKVLSHEIDGDRLQQLKKQLPPKLEKTLANDRESPLSRSAIILTAALGTSDSIASAKALVSNGTATDEERLLAISALIYGRDAQVLDIVQRMLVNGRSYSREFRGNILAALGRVDEPRVAQVVLDTYGKLDPELQPKAIELLTQRAAWSKSLVQAIGEGHVPAAALNVNQVNRLLASKDAELVKLVQDKWGTVRAERSPEREQIVARIRRTLQSEAGDPHKGQVVFRRVCGQCHKIHGEGQEVGPDITVNGRASLEQLLSNVLDPSLVIGASYQARMVATADGRVLTGLLVEDSPQRIVIKVQGGKLETVPRDDIEQFKVSELSMMPEGLENQLMPQELLDLFAFLMLDKPPDDPTARFIPGTPSVQAKPQ